MGFSIRVSPPSRATMGTSCKQVGLRYERVSDFGALWFWGFQGGRLGVSLPTVL